MAAATVVLGDIFEVKVACILGDQAGINVTHWRVAGVGAPAANAEDIATAFNIALEPLYKALMSNDAQYYGVRVQKIRPAPVDVAWVKSNLAGAGVIASRALPSQVSGLIKLGTDFAGRAERGRVYPPFPAQSSSDVDDTPTAIYLADLENLGGFYSSQFIPTVGPRSCTLNPVVYHRLPKTWTLITSYRARDTWATQRRRGATGRPNQAPPF